MLRSFVSEGAFNALDGFFHFFEEFWYGTEGQKEYKRKLCCTGTKVVFGSSTASVNSFLPVLIGVLTVYMSKFCCSNLLIFCLDISLSRSHSAALLYVACKHAECQTLYKFVHTTVGTRALSKRHTHAMTKETNHVITEGCTSATCVAQVMLLSRLHDLASVTIKCSKMHCRLHTV